MGNFSKDTYFLENEEIPEHWSTRSLGSISTQKSVTNNTGKELLSVFLDRGVIKFDDDHSKRTNGTSKDLSKYQLVEVGDFVLNNQQAWRGSVGVSSYEGIVSPAYIVLSLSKELNSSYANYLLRSPLCISQYAVNSKGVGSIQRNLYWDKLKLCKIPLPPYQEQVAIVTYLNKKNIQIDKLIFEAKKEINLLNELKQAEIAHMVTCGLNPNAPMKDSGIAWIGKIPAHWEVRRIKWLFKENDTRNVNLSYQLLSFSRSKGIIPYSDINDKAPSASDLSKYKIIRPGQLLENRMQAWSGMFGSSKIEGCVSPDYAVFDRTNENVNVDYYGYLFRTPLYVQQFANASKGVGDGFNRLYTPAFGAIYAIFPPSDEQTAIVSAIEAAKVKIDAMTSQLTRQITYLQELKQRIISDAVTGKIDVRNYNN